MAVVCTQVPDYLLQNYLYLKTDRLPQLSFGGFPENLGYLSC